MDSGGAKFLGCWSATRRHGMLGAVFAFAETLTDGALVTNWARKAGSPLWRGADRNSHHERSPWRR